MTHDWLGTAAFGGPGPVPAGVAQAASPAQAHTSTPAAVLAPGPIDSESSSSFGSNLPVTGQSGPGNASAAGVRIPNNLESQGSPLARALAPSQ